MAVILCGGVSTMFRKTAVGVVVVVAVLAGVAFFMPRPSPPVLAKLLTMYATVAPITVHPVSEGIYYVSGGMANSGIIVANSSVILVDAQMFAPAAKKVLKAIAQITPKPVSTIILTHSDPDHVNGLPAYPRGLEIIAQENTGPEMQEALQNPLMNTTTTPAELKDYLPTKTVKDSETIVVDGVTLQLMHLAPAHTDSDLIIYLPAQDVVFTGDILAPDFSQYPGIHLNKHGSSLGWIKTMQALIALNAQVYVSGHGQPLKRADLQERLQIAMSRRAEIEQLVAQHKTLDEVKAALNDPPPRGLAKMFPTFTETTYQELTQQ
ncbi:MBL fold metallo-hydrolase [Pseudomonas sp. NPDC087346]|uniref:MBL fold metallo-hydrolase n=1 Tax=Pseudomonas sp. NPDC087346 TaxID=3364438 RepID=UPI0038233AB6